MGAPDWQHLPVGHHDQEGHRHPHRPRGRIGGGVQAERHLAVDNGNGSHLCQRREHNWVGRLESSSSFHPSPTGGGCSGLTKRSAP